MLPCRSRLPALTAAVVATAAIAAGQRTPASPWRLREVARAECRGGAFLGASIAADARRMLTIGECGVAIEWDLAQATERRRFAPLADAHTVCLHPRDPWALVLAGRRPAHAHRLDLGTGRYTRLWPEAVSVVAFAADGTRAAVVFEDPNRGSRLAVYADAALRAAPPAPPDFERTFAGSWPTRLFFDPRGDAVYAGSYGNVWRVPLDGGDVARAHPELYGVLADGAEIRETRDRYRPTAAGVHWLAGWRELERGGSAPARWTVPDPYGTPALATDGTVVAPDGRGLLHLLGPAADRRRTVRGQPGPALQLCFDAGGRHLAIAGGCMLAILDVERGTTARCDGSFAVQAAPAPGEFLVLEAGTLATVRAASPAERTELAALPENAVATTFERSWTGTPALRRFLRDPQRRHLWLAHVAGAAAEPAAARLADGRLTALAATAVADASPYQVGLALAAGRDGDVVLASTTRPVQCGNGLERVRWWSTLRTYDRTGRQRAVRPLADVVTWLCTSPAGALVAVPACADDDGDDEPDRGRVHVYETRDLHRVHELVLGDGGIVAWEFVDERTALASDGEALLHVRIAAGIARKIAVDLPGPITQLALSPDRRLVAVACGADVIVLQRK